ncbi:MAG: ATP phosphoribosyltransferase [Lapillicoccus sp.]
MLRIAVPNKGSLSESAVDMLRESGYVVRRDSKELVITDVDNDVEFFYLRPRDIAIYVGSGTVDAGVTGRDLLLDSGSNAVEVMALGFGASTFRYAARPGDVARVADIEGKRVATSYPGLVEKNLAGHGVSASVVRLDGAVETAITLGVADVIADVVETGATLRSQGLAVFGEPILRSEAVLVRREGSAGPPSPATETAPTTPRLSATHPAEVAFEVLRRRLLGVITARSYVMMDYDVPAGLVDRACEITPGLESPTVSPLQDKAWCAVRSMVPRSRTNRVMDELYDLGARAILVTDIAACRI